MVRDLLEPPAQLFDLAAGFLQQHAVFLLSISRRIVPPSERLSRGRPLGARVARGRQSADRAGPFDRRRAREYNPFATGPTHPARSRLPPMYQLVVQVSFCGAHFLRDYEGPCASLHGHNYRVEARVVGSELDRAGMLVDFKRVKDLLEDIVRPFDHRVTNDVPPFDTMNPTAENMARYVCERLAEAVKPLGLQVASVGIWETEKYGAFYSPGQ
jgi:6-pyruvoyltetrahydropterin/6-carboxytetrahydropterin synthase